MGPGALHGRKVIRGAEAGSEEREACEKPVRMCEEIYNADEITAYIVAVSQTGTNLDEETAGKRTRASSIWNNVWNNYWGLD